MRQLAGPPSWSRFERVLIVLLALASLLCLPGCNGQRARQRQDLSDARAGIAAAQLLVEQLAANPAVKLYVDALRAVLAGATAHTAAAAQGAILPPPTKAPATIVGDPAAYQSQGEGSQRTAPTGGGWWGPGLTAAALVGLTLVRRFATPISPLFGVAAGWLHDVIADKATKETYEREAQHAAVLDQLAAHLRELPAAAQDELLNSVPPAVHAYLRSILTPGGPA